LYKNLALVPPDPIVSKQASKQAKRQNFKMTRCAQCKKKMTLAAEAVGKCKCAKSYCTAHKPDHEQICPDFQKALLEQKATFGSHLLTQKTVASKTEIC
jgi:hypothetical protein